MRAPYLDDGDVRLYLGDCVEVMAEMEPESVDAICTDPPYALGFMGKVWDHAGVAFDPATWSEALRVLKPGGHLLAFGGPRTFHRLTCAIEDAGFEVRDCISYMFGSGFPKSKNLDGDWQGWGTALKPGWEPVVVARKPLAGTVAANVLAHGTGALNVDGCRVGTHKDVPASPRRQANGGDAGGVYGRYEPPPTDTEGWNPNTGRWPANVALDSEAARLLDEQSGDRRSGARAAGSYGAAGALYNRGSVRGVRALPAVDASTGGASRFFYTAKASTAERDGTKHPTVKPLDLMRWLVRLVTPPGGLVLDPFSGSGTTLLAARREGLRAVGIEREPDYAKDAAHRLRELSLFGGAA